MMSATKIMNGRNASGHRQCDASADHQVGPEVLEERNDQPRRIQAVSAASAIRVAANGECRQELVGQLGAAGQAEVAAMHDLQIIVGETDGAEGQRRQHGDPDEAIGQVGPEQRRNQHGDHDEDAAHGRRAGLLLVGLGAVFADVLADLEFAQAMNDGRANDQSDKQCSQAGEGGAEGQIAEDSERADMKDDKSLLVEQPIEQIRPRSQIDRCSRSRLSATPFKAANSPSKLPALVPSARRASLQQHRIARLSLRACSHSPASSGVADKLAATPASCAPSTMAFAKPRTPSTKSMPSFGHVAAAVAMHRARPRT